MAASFIENVVIHKHYDAKLLQARWQARFIEHGVDGGRPAATLALVKPDSQEIGHSQVSEELGELPALVICKWSSLRMRRARYQPLKLDLPLLFLLSLLWINLMCLPSQLLKSSLWRNFCFLIWKLHFLDLHFAGYDTVPHPSKPLAEQEWNRQHSIGNKQASKYWLSWLKKCRQVSLSQLLRKYPARRRRYGYRAS